MSIYRRSPAQREDGDTATPVPADPGREPVAAGGPRRWPATIAVLALVVSACGTTSISDDGTAEGAENENGAAVVTSSDDTAEATDDGADGDGDDVSGEDVPTSESESAMEAAGPAVNVPSVEVLDVADGSVINLAEELAGENRAILFWFWAPH